MFSFSLLPLLAWANVLGQLDSATPTTQSSAAIEQVSGVAPKSSRISQTPANRSASTDPSGLVAAGQLNSSGAGTTNPDTEATNLPAAVAELCRQAELQERPPPESVDCAALSRPRAQTLRTAEGSLLELLGISGTVTATPPAESTQPQDADAIARRLATGDVQPATDTNAAGVLNRQRPPGPR